MYGQRSERSARLIEQSAFVFEELRTEATEDELAAEAAIARTTIVTAFRRQRPERNTFPNTCLANAWSSILQPRANAVVEIVCANSART